MRLSWRRWVIPLLGIVALAVVLVLFLRSASDQNASDAGPGASLPTLVTPSTTPSTTPSSARPSTRPTTPGVDCEGPETQFNIEGEPQSSLLPNCGTEAAVTVAEEKKSGLGLACGGAHPSILFKTTTPGSTVSICGKDAVGVDFRVVVRERGGKVRDMPGEYVWQRDAFVGEAGGVRYEIRGYDGSVHITRKGTTTVQESDDWISLDNEHDDG